MTSEPENLLPCPFCNGGARWVEDTGALDTPFGLVTDHTPTCFLSGRMMAEWSDIITAWNTRLSSPVSGTDMVDREAVRDDVADLLHVLHWEAWKAGVFTSQEEWPDEDEQADLARGVDSVAVGEHFQAWGDEAVDKLTDRILSASPSTPIPVIAEAGERERQALANLHRLQHDGLNPSVRPVVGGSIIGWAADEIVALRAALSTPATLDNTAKEDTECTPPLSAEDYARIMAAHSRHTVSNATAPLLEWARSQQAFSDNSLDGAGRGHIDENHRFKLRDMVARIDAALLSATLDNTAATEPCGYCGDSPCVCDATDLCQVPGCRNRTDAGVCPSCDDWVTAEAAALDKTAVERQLRTVLQEAHDTLHECTAVLHADDCRKVAAVMERCRATLTAKTEKAE